MTWTAVRARVGVAVSMFGMIEHTASFSISGCAPCFTPLSSSPHGATHPADGLLSRDDLSRMFLSSSMLVLDKTMSDVASAFVSQIFELLNVEPHGKISAERIEEFQRANPGRFEDVWELIGRSMLKDFGSKRSASK